METFIINNQHVSWQLFFYVRNKLGGSNILAIWLFYRSRKADSIPDLIRYLFNTNQASQPAKMSKRFKSFQNKIFSDIPEHINNRVGDLALREPAPITAPHIKKGIIV